jgi:hypothetical protein
MLAMPRPFRTEMADTVFTIVANNNEIAKRLDAMIELGNKNYTIDEMTLSAMAAMMTLNAKIIAGLFEDSERVLDKIEAFERESGMKIFE